MGEGGGGEEKGRRFFPSPLFLFRSHFSPFPQKRLILRLERCFHQIISSTLLIMTPTPTPSLVKTSLYGIPQISSCSNRERACVTVRQVQVRW